MNREILFRGKRIDNGWWMEGYCSKYFDGFKTATCIAQPTRETITGSLCYEVDPSTVGQYTGLTDKNGKRIFEGDILRQKKNGVYGFPFSVVFDDGGFMWNENERRDFLYQSICDTCEVIGNIHDSPELLEGE